MCVCEGKKVRVRPAKKDNQVFIGFTRLLRLIPATPAHKTSLPKPITFQKKFLIPQLTPSTQLSFLSPIPYNSPLNLSPPHQFPAHHSLSPQPSLSKSKRQNSILFNPLPGAGWGASSQRCTSAQPGCTWRSCRSVGDNVCVCVCVGVCGCGWLGANTSMSARVHVCGLALVRHRLFFPTPRVTHAHSHAHPSTHTHHTRTTRLHPHTHPHNAHTHRYKQREGPQTWHWPMREVQAGVAIFIMP